MGLEAVEMDYKEDGKLENNIRLVSIEKLRDELFTSGNTNLSGHFFIVIALRRV